MNAIRILFSALFMCFGLNNYAQTQTTGFGEPTEWGAQIVALSADNQIKSVFAQYEFLSDFGMDQCAWVLFVAPHDGLLSLSAPADKNPYEIAVFRAETSDFNVELKSENAFLLGAHKLAAGKELKMDAKTNQDGFAPSLFQILKGQSILVYINASSADKVNFNIDLKSANNLEARKAMVPFEYRKNTSSKTLKVVVRDGITGLPLKARINIQGLKGIDNVYNASDFTFDLVSSKSASISCDAPGYFNKDIELKLIPGKDNLVTIKLLPFSSVLNMRLDGVQFKEGSADPLPTAYKDLDKLVDFMNSNPSIQIEIQGHVNAPNSQSKGAQKLSEKRAKFVYDYLVSKGVDAKRMTFVGYGNTVMLFDNPKNEAEERANRRVEIKILD
jgi:outer membrane protein OmpA-like peptidoglycan-associated protein